MAIGQIWWNAIKIYCGFWQNTMNQIRSGIIAVGFLNRWQILGRDIIFQQGIRYRGDKK